MRKLRERLGVKDEEEIESYKGRERQIHERMRRIWDKNDIEEYGSWTEKIHLDGKPPCADYYCRDIEIYEVNGECRYYQFYHPGNRPGWWSGSSRYTPQPEGDDCVHEEVEERELDDVDWLILGRFKEELAEIGEK